MYHRRSLHHKCYAYAMLSSSVVSIAIIYLLLRGWCCVVFFYHLDSNHMPCPSLSTRCESYSIIFHHLDKDHIIIVYCGPVLYSICAICRVLNAPKVIAAYFISSFRLLVVDCRLLTCNHFDILHIIIRGRTIGTQRQSLYSLSMVDSTRRCWSYRRFTEDWIHGTQERINHHYIVPSFRKTSSVKMTAMIK